MALRSSQQTPLEVFTASTQVVPQIHTQPAARPPPSSANGGQLHTPAQLSGPSSRYTAPEACTTAPPLTARERRVDGLPTTPPTGVRVVDVSTSSAAETNGRATPALTRLLEAYDLEHVFEVVRVIGLVRAAEKLGDDTEASPRSVASEHAHLTSPATRNDHDGTIAPSPSCPTC